MFAKYDCENILKEIQDRQITIKEYALEHDIKPNNLQNALYNYKKKIKNKPTIFEVEDKSASLSDKGNFEFEIKFENNIVAKFKPKSAEDFVAILRVIKNV